MGAASVGVAPAVRRSKHHNKVPCSTLQTKPEHLTAVSQEVGANGGRLRGFVKSYCPIAQTGWIDCEGACVRLTGLEAERVGLTAGAFVTFALGADEEGKQLAVDITILVEGDARGRGRLRDMAMNLGGKEIDWGKTYTGRIVRLFRETGPLPQSWNHKVPGLCFIACDETHKLFQHDIWAYPSQVVNRKIGDMLSFKVRLDHWWNYPVAYEIRYLPEASKATNGQAASRLKQGVAVRLCGIRSAPHLNGVIGECKYCKDDIAGRWVVKLTTGVSKIVKPANLEVIAEGSADSGAGPRKMDAVTSSDRHITSQLAEQSEKATMVVEATEALQESLGADSLEETEKADVAAGVGSGPEVESDSQQITLDSTGASWQKFQTDDGSSWWYCEASGDWFMEDDPGSWTKNWDEKSGKYFWWRSDGKCFWAL